MRDATTSLNEYHRRFLAVLATHSVRFIVIGGQARHLFSTHEPADLDIWVDIAACNIPALENAIIYWAQKHPLHTRQNTAPPLQLRPRVQMKFPEDDCYYLSADLEPRAIKPENGVDILTSIGEHEFAEFYQRAVRIRIDGAEVAYLCEADTLVISPPTEKQA